MKRLMLLIAMAAALAFTPGQASADMILTVSGTAEIQKTNSETKTAFVGTTGNTSFNNKQIYYLVSNAVANVGQWAGGRITPSHLPADGYIAFDPNDSKGPPLAYPYNGPVTGIFYVTNKSGYHFPLVGFDSNDQYYSWAELDTQNTEYSDAQEIGVMFGFAFPFNGVAAYNLSKSNGKGTATETSSGLLYIHDDPYCYDDANNPFIFWNNFPLQGSGDDMISNNISAIEIRGVVTTSLKILSNNITGGSITLTGTGNLENSGGRGFIVKTGTAKLK